MQIESPTWLCREESRQLGKICLPLRGGLYFRARKETADFRGWRAPHFSVMPAQAPGLIVLEHFRFYSGGGASRAPVFAYGP